MESGKIPDDAITLLSSYADLHKPYQARLRKATQGCAWSPTSFKRSSLWLQVDQGRLAIFTRMATQGTCYNYIESYSFAYSKDVKKWSYAQETDGVTKVIFPEISDKMTVPFVL